MQKIEQKKKQVDNFIIIFITAHTHNRCFEAFCFLLMFLFLILPGKKRKRIVEHKRKLLMVAVKLS